MPGPPRKPEIVRRQEGNADKRPARDEPEATPGIGPMPDWLDAQGRKMWELLVPELESMRSLKRIDYFALESAVSAWSLAVQCRRRIKKYGITVKTSGGFPVQRPEIAIEKGARQTFHKFATELGLTSAARVRLGIEAAPGGEDDEMERLLA